MHRSRKLSKFNDSNHTAPALVAETIRRALSSDTKNVKNDVFLLRRFQLHSHPGYTELSRQETCVGIGDAHTLPAFF
jgi:hypothetical protein